jgi:hypothetical protein
LSLEQNTTASGGTGFCTDFARSSRARVSTGSNPDPACASGGICFVGLAGDAVTWADRSAAAGGTNAPATLTATQLKNIYLCKTTNWKAVGGKAGTIQPFLPQTGSGTLSFFLTALGGGVTAITPGPCVSSDDGTGNGTNTLIENEGVAPALNSANAIWPYSAADYDAQVQHDAQCTNGTNCGYPGTAKCTPTSKQNKFGCDIHGVAQINPIGTSNPTKPFPAHIGACGGTTGVTCAVINQSFNKLFQRVVYDVVRFSGSTTDHIPSYLEPFFAASNTSNPGWACTNSKAKADIKSYGFAAISNTKPVHCGSVQ